MQTSPENVALPICLDITDEGIGVVLAKIPKLNLREPFLIDSLSTRFGVADVSKEIESEQNILVRPLHYNVNDERIIVLPLYDFIAKYVALSTPSQRTNFIFHMSRCGSTLATQMIAAVDRFYMISEPNIVNDILNPSLILPQDISRWDLLRATINAIYLFKPEHCDRLFIKFRSWNILFLAEILAAFPNTNWMFIHRNGAEVLESVLRDPPGWLRGRYTNKAFFSKILGVPQSELQLMGDSEYSARLLGAFCSRAALHKDERSVYVSYEDIRNNLPRIIDRSFSLNMNVVEKDAMLARATFYSKDGSRDTVFTDDSARKRAAISKSDMLNAEKFVESARKKLL